MRKKSPIDVSLPHDDGSNRSKLYKAAALLACLAIVLFASIAAFRYFSPQPEAAQGTGEIRLIVEPQRLVEGQNASVTAYSTCGNFTISADGRKICDASSGQQLSIPLPAGNYSISAANANCSASAPLQVVARVCQDGQEQGCTKNGCPGTQACSGGSWSGCELPERKCMPGVKIGCAYNSCSFGYTTCDKCGAGFGPCLPEGQSAAPLNGNSLSCG